VVPEPELCSLLVLWGHLTEVQWVNRDIPYHTKLATVVQVLVLKTKEVPYETPGEQTCEEVIPEQAHPSVLTAPHRE